MKTLALRVVLTLVLGMSLGSGLFAADEDVTVDAPVVAESVVVESIEPVPVAPPAPAPVVQQKSKAAQLQAQVREVRRTLADPDLADIGFGSGPVS